MPTAFHQRSQHGVHSGLITLALRFQPVENVDVQADIDTLWGCRHMEFDAPPKTFIGLRGVRIVDVLILDRLDFPEPFFSRY